MKLYGQSDTLVIKNCTIAATGYLCGISGGNGGDNLLLIMHCISYWNNLWLNL